MSVVPTALTAVAVAFGTAILLFALSFEPALDVRYDRGAWRDTPGPRGVAEELAGTTLISLTNDHVDGRPLAIDVAGLGSGASVPPGLSRLPDAGETFVSPALAELMAAAPPDELADRFGAIGGTIGEEGLQAPNELVAINGLPAATLAAQGRGRDRVRNQRHGADARLGGQPDGGGRRDRCHRPVAVFVASATRLAAARRERRLVALRLSGATSGQVALLAAVDAMLISILGALLGIVVFLDSGRLSRFPARGLDVVVDAIAPHRPGCPGDRRGADRRRRRRGHLIAPHVDLATRRGAPCQSDRLTAADPPSSSSQSWRSSARCGWAPRHSAIWH